MQLKYRLNVIENFLNLIMRKTCSRLFGFSENISFCVQNLSNKFIVALSNIWTNIYSTYAYIKNRRWQKNIMETFLSLAANAMQRPRDVYIPWCTRNSFSVLFTYFTYLLLAAIAGCVQDIFTCPTFFHRTTAKAISTFALPTTGCLGRTCRDRTSASSRSKNQVR